MPLFVGGKPLDSVPCDIEKLLSENPELANSNEQLKSKESVLLGGEGVLYVNQREFAAVKPDAEHIDILGTDDATTCHILLVKHTGSGVLCLSHLDGTDTTTAIHKMILRTNELSVGGPEGRLEVHIVGGFLDDRQTSMELTCEVFQALIDLTDTVHLMTACVSAANDTVRQDVHFPIIYGLAVRLTTGELFPATFADKGPDIDIRSAANFAVNEEVIEIFRDGLLTIGPFDWVAPNPLLLRFIYAPDFFIRRYLSTSPEQEPPHFEEHIRQCLSILRDHSEPMVTLFPGGQPRLYHKNSLKTWTMVETSML